MKVEDSDSNANEDGATDVLQRIRAFAASVPGVDRVHGTVRGVENALLSQLKERLDALDGGQGGVVRAPARASDASADGPRPAGLRERMDALIQRSLEQTPESATEELFGSLLDEMVPDEARILTAVSDGSRIAFCHLDAAPRMGANVRVLAYQSRIGNETGVMLNDQVPYYLQHLIAMGLLEEGPEDKQLVNSYEMIESGTEVREASERISSEMKMRPKITRHAAYLSDFGARFWAACNPD